MTIHQKFNLKQVINASGKMTILGVSKVSDKLHRRKKRQVKPFLKWLI
jgi:L-seryl-tRNA(Ser) seleniumtransferase